MFAKLFKSRNNNTPIKRKSIDKINFNKKSAVVLVGVSCIGKTTFAKNFIAKHPSFELISYDMCYRETVKQNAFIPKSDAQYLAEDLFNNKLFEYQSKNIIIDRIVLNSEERAKLIHKLHELDYTVHVVYFTIEYTEKHIRHRQILRSIEMAIMSQNPDCYALTMELDINPIEFYASKYNKTLEQVIDEFKYTAAVQNEYLYQNCAYDREIEKYNVIDQEDSGSFMEGADYYYEIT